MNSRSCSSLNLVVVVVVVHWVEDVVASTFVAQGASQKNAVVVVAVAKLVVGLPLPCAVGEALGT
jgi:hypothetical protein